jgi:hypothetical protein
MQESGYQNLNCAITVGIHYFTSNLLQLCTIHVVFIYSFKSSRVSSSTISGPVYNKKTAFYLNIILIFSFESKCLRIIVPTITVVSKAPNSCSD